MQEKLTAHETAIKELDFLIRSGRPIIYICTHEETRVMESIKANLGKDWTLLSWDVADGVKAHTDFELPGKYLNQKQVLSWFKDLPKYDKGYLINVLKDYQKFIGSEGNSQQLEHEVVRLLRNISNIRNERKTIILMGTSLYLPAEIEKLVSVIDWPLPEHDDLKEKINKLLLEAKSNSKIANMLRLDYDDKEEFHSIVESFRGLTIDEVEMLFTYTLIKHRELNSVAISSQKRDIIRKSGIVEWIEPESDMDSVGGLNELKKWVYNRKKGFSQEAIDYGLPASPKGLLMVGIQGCGKSLLSKSVAHNLGLPLLRLDIGKIFSGIVGSSEENIRNAIKIAESIGACVLWCDEIEKGFSGSQSSGLTDGGTTSRVLGTFLTWMQEKKSQVFVVATANDISNLPPELLRKGRFDEIFFVDLPNEEDRSDIFNIHLKKRKRNPIVFDVKKLSAMSPSYTGAEIESAIESAMYIGFNEDREFDSHDIELALLEMVPLAVTMKEKIDDLRTWADVRARNASITKYKQPKAIKHMKTMKTIVSDIDSLNADIDLNEEL